MRKLEKLRARERKLLFWALGLLIVVCILGAVSTFIFIAERADKPNEVETVETITFTLAERKYGKGE